MTTFSTLNGYCNFGFSICQSLPLITPGTFQMSCKLTIHLKHLLLKTKIAGKDFYKPIMVSLKSTPALLHNERHIQVLLLFICKTDLHILGKTSYIAISLNSIHGPVNTCFFMSSQGSYDISSPFFTKASDKTPLTLAFVAINFSSFPCVV